MTFFKDFYHQRPVLSLFIGTILIPLIVVVAYGYAYVQGSNANISGHQSVQGIYAPVTIKRDKQGVTYIEAQEDHDAFFAMGFAHAQDRMWQLEVQRRITRGELAEIFGRSAVGFDIYIRTLSLHRHAQSSLAVLSDKARASLEAYAAGINSWLSGKPQLPIEFVLLGVEPQPWQAVDSLAWIKMFALTLSGNYQKDLNRLVLSQSLSAQKAQQLATTDGDGFLSPDTSTLQLEKLAQLSQWHKNIELKWGIGRQSVGSNAWVIAGQHNDNGLASLANDPHLGLSLPSSWYTVDIKAKNLNVSGMSLVGLPLVMLGKNRHIGWGATNMLADTMDLYYQQINTNNKNQYRYDGKWLEFETTVESIAVKADFPAWLREPLKPIEIAVRYSKHGPVISDVTGGFDQPLALRWTGLSGKDSSYEAFLGLNYASDWTSFKQAMSYHIAPAMNMFYVDDKQNIGYLGIGKIPVRQYGNGSLPVQGWLSDTDWQGFIPPNEMPQSFNPPKGYLLSANNNPVDEDYPYFISLDWEPQQRAQRIEQLIEKRLQSNKKFTLDAQQQMQLDKVDKQALNMQPILSKVKTDQAHLQKMVDYIANWDGNADVDSVAASIYVTWMRNLADGLFADEFEHYWGQFELAARHQQIISEVQQQQIEAALLDDKVDWCDNKRTDEHEDCHQVLLDALSSSYDELDKLLGSDVDDWRWGDIHHAVFTHRPFSSVKLLDLWFERQISSGGLNQTIDLSRHEFEADEGYKQVVGAAFRAHMQFSPSGDNYWYINAMGQSGNVASNHYDDMMEPFVNGQFYTFDNNLPEQGLTLTPLATPQGQ